MLIIMAPHPSSRIVAEPIATPVPDGSFGTFSDMTHPNQTNQRHIANLTHCIGTATLHRTNYSQCITRPARRLLKVPSPRALALYAFGNSCGFKHAQLVTHPMSGNPQLLDRIEVTILAATDAVFIPDRDPNANPRHQVISERRRTFPDRGSPWSSDRGGT